MDVYVFFLGLALVLILIGFKCIVDNTLKLDLLEKKLEIANSQLMELFKINYDFANRVRQVIADKRVTDSRKTIK